jgi:peptidoglycan/xylan/chitin deacetylase (PgdA/CDA1 family)
LNIRHIVRNAIAHVLYYSGILPVLARVRFNNRVLVLMYHRVLAKKDDGRVIARDGMAVSSEVFEMQMRYIAEHFDVMSLNEFVGCIEKNKGFGRNRCLVTFDDGWEDNYRKAYPVLKRIGIPATVFLATDFMGRKDPFWQERTVELLSRLRDAVEKDAERRTGILRECLDRKVERILTCDRKALKEEVAAYVHAMKGKNPDEIKEIIGRFDDLVAASGAGISRESHFMSWDEIRDMATNGISFASHGKSHVILTRLPRPEVEREARESRTTIQELLGLPVTAFSFPNGDYSEDVIDIVRNCGYKVAFSTQEGTHAASDDPYRIKRYNIHEDMTANIPMFMARIVGLW